MGSFFLCYSHSEYINYNRLKQVTTINIHLVVCIGTARTSGYVRVCTCVCVVLNIN